MTLSGFAILGVILDSQQLHGSMTTIELDHKCIQCRRMSETPGLLMVRSCRSRRLTWTGRLSTPSPSLRQGMIVRLFLEFHLIWFPTALKFFLAGLIDFLRETPRETTREEYHDVHHADGTCATVAGHSHPSPQR